MYKKVLNYFVVLAVALLSCFALTGCSDDDYEDNDLIGGVLPQAGAIIGEWRVTHDTDWEKEDGEIIDEWDDYISDNSYVYVFKSDGKCEFYENGRLDETGYYTYKSNKLTIRFVDEDSGEVESQTAKCTIKNGHMTITYSEKEVGYGFIYEFYNMMELERITD